MIEKVRLSEKFAQFHDTWSPKIVGELNDSHVKLVKLQGEFVWHLHEQEDELSCLPSPPWPYYAPKRGAIQDRVGLAIRGVHFAISEPPCLTF